MDEKLLAILESDLTVSEGGKKIGEGQWPACVIGVGVQMFDPHKDLKTTEQQPKVTVIWQVKGRTEENEAGESEPITQTMKSRLYSPVVAEKSSLYNHLLKGWAKASTPDEAIAKLSNGGKLNLLNLIGKKALLTISNEPGKDGKVYAEIKLVQPLKASQAEAAEFLPDEEVPEYIHTPKREWGAIKWLEGVKFGTRNTGTESAPNPNALPEQEDDLPF